MRLSLNENGIDTSTIRYLRDYIHICECYTRALMPWGEDSLACRTTTHALQTEGCARDARFER